VEPEAKIPVNQQENTLRQMLIEAFRRLSLEGKLKTIRTAQQLVRKELLSVNTKTP